MVRGACLPSRSQEIFACDSVPVIHASVLPALQSIANPISSLLESHPIFPIGENLAGTVGRPQGHLRT
jgi:hypothetical protein